MKKKVSEPLNRFQTSREWGCLFESDNPEMMKLDCCMKAVLNVFSHLSFSPRPASCFFMLVCTIVALKATRG